MTPRQAPEEANPPEPSWDMLEGMVIFMGTGRSGSSLVGALLDAHSKIIIPNEYDLLSRIEKPRETMFSKLYNLSKIQADIRAGGGSYDYKVPNEWQGRVKNDQLTLIGDKKASKTSELGFEKIASRLRRLLNITHLPLKIIHVTRNPFDNIATLTLVKYFHKKYGKHDPKVDNITHDFEDDVDAGISDPLELKVQQTLDDIESFKLAVDRGDDEPLSSEQESSFLSEWIEHYFKRMDTVYAIDQAIRANPLFFGDQGTEIIHVDYNALVANPETEIHNLIYRLGLYASPQYYTDTASIVWQSNHYTRLYVKWGQDRICDVLRNTQRFPFLQHYMLEGTPGDRNLSPPCRDQCFPGLWPCPCTHNLNVAANKVDTCKSN